MSYDDNNIILKTLIGKTIAQILVNNTLIFKDNPEPSEEINQIKFITTDGIVYDMFHQQDCCESVYVEDINGDLMSLIGNPILVAEEISSVSNVNENIILVDKMFNLPLKNDESYTYTFYKFATINGHIDIRWYGYSNGYYSESVTVSKSVTVT